MLSILCVRLTIQVKVGMPESFKVGWYSPQKTGSSHLKLFDSLVSPILLYNCEIWVFFFKSVRNNYDKFVSRIFDERITPENMQNGLSGSLKASNHAVKGELGRFPLHLIIYLEFLSTS